MARLAVSVVGADRPGIVARVAQVLLEQGASLFDTTMTTLAGNCALLALVDVDADAQALETALAEGGADLRLEVAVRPVGRGSPSPPPTHVLSLYGPDRRGLVFDVAATLAELRVNITDLTVRVLEAEQPVCAVQLEVNAGDEAEATDLVATLSEQVDDIEVHAQALETAPM